MFKNEDFCDQTIINGLKEIGFPFKTMRVKGVDNKLSEQILPVTLYEVQKWLRNTRGIFVLIEAPYKTENGLGWSYTCCNKPITDEDDEVCFATGGLYDSYEEALMEGIKGSLY